MWETMFGAGAVVGLVAALWGRLKLLADRAISLLVVRATVDSATAGAVSDYCFRNLKRSPFGDKKYQTHLPFHRPDRRYRHVLYEAIGDGLTVFWSGWRPVVVRIPKLVTNGSYTGPEEMTVSSIRWVVDIERFLAHAVSLRDTEQGVLNAASRFRIVTKVGSFGDKQDRGGMLGSAPSAQATPAVDVGSLRPVSYPRCELGPMDPPQPFAGLALSADVEKVLLSVRRWFKSKDWYESVGIPWRRGVLLAGPPGTGKTSVTRAIAAELGVPLYRFDLATMTNGDLTRTWDEAMADAPCVVLLEDIDCVFDGRHRVGVGPDAILTFDCLLNTVGGAKETSGSLLIATSNRPEAVDPALLRPGRLDETVTLGPLSEQGRVAVANRICRDCQDEIDAVVRAGEGESGAKFQARCEQIALARYWGKRESDCAGGT